MYPGHTPQSQLNYPPSMQSAAENNSVDSADDSNDTQNQEIYPSQNQPQSNARTHVGCFGEVVTRRIRRDANGSIICLLREKGLCTCKPSIKKLESYRQHVRDWVYARYSPLKCPVS
jgi:hypothetical protein